MTKLIIITIVVLGLLGSFYLSFQFSGKAETNQEDFNKTIIKNSEIDTQKVEEEILNLFNQERKQPIERSEKLDSFVENKTNSLAEKNLFHELEMNGIATYNSIALSYSAWGNKSFPFGEWFSEGLVNSMVVNDNFSGIVNKIEYFDSIGIDVSCKENENMLLVKEFNCTLRAVVVETSTGLDDFNINEDLYLTQLIYPTLTGLIDPIRASINFSCNKPSRIILLRNFEDNEKFYNHISYSTVDNIDLTTTSFNKEVVINKGNSLLYGTKTTGGSVCSLEVELISFA